MEQVPGKKAAPRVLVVEDDPDALVFVGKLLSRISIDGVPTATCGSARYALKTLGRFDIVIADVTLPDGDGVALAAEAKRDHGCSTVIMSGHNPPASGMPDGIDLWIIKPVDFNELQKAVRSLVKWI
jgi:DNA-binding response OmpR family regulator